MLLSAASIDPVGPVGQRDREGGETRRIARDRGVMPVAPPKTNRKNK